MPQMSPYNWLILFFYFNLIMMLLMTLIYYNNLLKINSSNLIKMNFYKWMW